MSNRLLKPGCREHNFTQSEIRRMRDRREAGVCYREIANAFGTSANTVRLVVQGIRTAGRARPVRVEAEVPQ